MTVCYLPKPSSPLANKTALPTSTTPLSTFPSTDHFSFYLLTYVLSPLPSSVHTSVALLTTSVTELLPKQARQPISLFSTDYAAGVLLSFSSTDYSPLPPSRGEESGRLIY